MDGRRNLLARLLAGLQAGILGGLVTVIWFMVLSVWSLRSPWALVNLFAASAWHAPSWSANFGIATFTGIALHLAACGFFGMFIGWALPKPPAPSHMSLAGFTFGAILSLMLYEFFWRRLVPSLGAYTTPGAIVTVHLLFGVCVGQFPRFYLKLEPPTGEVLEFPASVNGPESESGSVDLL